jgi:ribosomal-protein-alanine N-acetyltransferase
MQTPGSLVEGRRVLLRTPVAGDRDEFLDRVLASRRLHRRWVAPPADPQAFDAYLRRAMSADVETLVVCRREDGAIVGVYSLSQIFYGPLRSAYLGYYAFEPFGGRGYMHDGLRLLLRHAFGSLALHRVEANIQPENEASIALVRGAGFRHEGYARRYLKIAGRWRDHERWAILAEDPNGARPRTKNHRVIAF